MFLLIWKAVERVKPHKASCGCRKRALVLDCSLLFIMLAYLVFRYW